MIITKSRHIPLDNIKVPKHFAESVPAPEKIAARVDAFRKTGGFDREIIVDKDNNLLDGYTAYLVAKMLNVHRVRCVKVWCDGIGANAYQQAALRTAGTVNPDPLLINGVMGLNGEAGECIDLVKKHLFQGHELDKEKLAKELGDVAWYLAIASYAIGYNLDDVLKMNIQKLKERYPDGFDAERSNNRKEE